MGLLDVETPAFREMLRGEGAFSYRSFLDDGVVYAELGSPGAYIYEVFGNPGGRINFDAMKNGVQIGGGFAESFAILRPSGTVAPYKLAIDKPHHRTDDNGKADAYVSLIDHKMRLSGVVDFLKISFEENANAAIKIDNRSFPVIERRDNDYYKTIQSLHDGNVVDITLDESNVFLADVFIRNKDIVCNGDFNVSIIISGMLSLEETCNPEIGAVERLGDIIESRAPYAIKGRYQSDFGELKPYMVFRNRTMVQPVQELSRSNTVVIATDSPKYQEAVKKGNDYLDWANLICGMDGVAEYLTANQI